MTDVVALVTQTLAEAVTALGDDAPDRRYVGHAQPVYDCEQIVCWLEMLRPKLIDAVGGTGDLSISAKCSMVWVARLGISLAKCVPTLDDGGNVPSPEDLTAAYSVLLADGTDIARHLSRRWAEKEWPCDIACGQVTFLSLVPVPPLGGFAGWTLLVDVQLT